MSWSLARLALTGGKGSWTRLIAIAAGVAVGVALFQLLWGAAGGLQARDQRITWLRVGGAPSVTASGTQIPLTAGAVLVDSDVAHFGADQITVREIAATPDSTVRLPGLDALPNAGHYYASPALARLIRSVPADELGDRFGVSDGTVPDSMLMGPDELVAIVGEPEAAVRSNGYATLVSDFTNSANAAAGASVAYRTVMIIGGIAIFFPVVIFISIVTGLGAAQRQERFSTLRLIGASPRTVTRLTIVETAVTSLIGALGGVVLAVLLRPLAAQVTVTGSRFYPDDLNVSPAATIAVVLVVCVVAVLAAAQRIRRAGIGPLGAARQQMERQPRIRRLLPLLAGLAAMGSVTLGSHGLSNAIIELGLIGGFCLILVGIVLAGPWLSFVFARSIGRHARSAEAVIASNRITRRPAVIFRSVSGLVIAVFLVSVFAGMSSSYVQANQPQQSAGLLPDGALAATVTNSPDLQKRLAAVAHLPGVAGTVSTYSPRAASDLTKHDLIVSASDARLLGFTRVPDSAYVAFDSSRFLSTQATDAPSLVPAAAPEASSQMVGAVFVLTDGTTSALERARTALQASGVTRGQPDTRADLADSGMDEILGELSTLANLGAFFAIAIAGLSLAVSTVSGILDRKRPFGLMRLIGMPAGSLRRIIAYEAGAPLLGVAGIAIALGFAVAWLLIHGLTSSNMTPPAPGYYILVATGLALAATAITVAAVGIRKNTTIAATRFE